MRTLVVHKKHSRTPSSSRPMNASQPRKHDPRLRVGGVGQRLRAPRPRWAREGARSPGNSPKTRRNQFHRGGASVSGVEMAAGAIAPVMARSKAEGRDCRGAAQWGRVWRRGGCRRRGGRGFGEAAVFYVQVGGAPVRRSALLQAGEGFGRGWVFVLGVYRLSRFETYFVCFDLRGTSCPCVCVRLGVFGCVFKTLLHPFYVD